MIDSRESLDFFRVMYNNRLSIDEYTGEAKDSLEDFLDFNCYDARLEYKYFNKMAYKFKGRLNFEMVDSMIRRNLNTENIVLFKSMYNVLCMTDEELIKKLKLNSIEMKNLEVIKTELANDFSLRKISKFQRNLKMWARRNYYSPLFKMDEPISKTDPDFLGISKEYFVVGYQIEYENKSKDDYNVRVYKGNFNNNHLDVIKEYNMNYMDNLFYDYKLLDKLLDIHNLDIWVTICS